MKRPAAAAKKKPMAKAKAAAKKRPAAAAKKKPIVDLTDPFGKWVPVADPARHQTLRQYWDLFAAEPDIVSVGEFAVAIVDDADGTNGKWVRVGSQTVRQLIIAYCGLCASLNPGRHALQGGCNDFEHNYCMIWYSRRGWSNPLPLDNLVCDVVKNGANCMIHRIRFVNRLAMSGSEPRRAI